MKKQILEELGLTKNEVKVYLTLLKLGSALAGEITEESGIHRRNVYDSIERLMRKGLVGHVIKGNKKYFEAVTPHRFLTILEEKKDKLRIKEKNIVSILPELLLLQKLSREKQGVIIYKGKEGIKTILDDVLETKKQNLVLGAHKPPKAFKNYLEKFHKKRIKLGIIDKLIFNKNDMKRAKELAKLPFTEVRFMPKKYDSQTAINIYGNKVAILMWSEPIGILVENKKVANSFREYFKLLWKVTEKC